MYSAILCLTAPIAIIFLREIERDHGENQSKLKNSEFRGMCKAKKEIKKQKETLAIDM